MPKKDQGNRPNSPQPFVSRLKKERCELHPLLVREEAFVVAKFMLSEVRPSLAELLLDSLVQKYQERPDVYKEHTGFYKNYVESNKK